MDTIGNHKLISVHVKTNRPECDYSTSVNGWLTDETIKAYFVGNQFHDRNEQPFICESVVIER